MAARLFIGNLPTDTTENDLENLLKRFQFSNVELKRKNNLDQETVFAYVNVSKKQTNKCLKELNGYEWKNLRLNVEVAKESFLDRLKKERLKRDETNTNQETLTPLVLKNHSPKNKKIFFDKNEELNDEKTEEFVPGRNLDRSHEDEPSIPRKRNLPMFQGIAKTKYDEEQPEAAEHISSQEMIPTEQVRESNIDITMKKFEDFSSVWRNVSTANSFQFGNKDVVYHNSIPAKKFDRTLKDPEITKLGEVRKEETCKLDKGSRYSGEMKRKTALEDKWNAMKERKNLIRNALKNITRNTETTRENRTNMPLSNGSSSVENTSGSNSEVIRTNITLFNDDSSEEDTLEPNFKVKSYLDGNEGLKRLNLKAKLANDERFRIDERFFDGDGNETQKSNILKRGQNKFGLIKRYDSSPSSLPSSQSHAAQIEPNKKKIEKKTKKDPIEQRTKHKETPEPEVSKEKYYSVSDNLKEAFKKSEEKTSFSLSAMFDTQLERNKQSCNEKQPDLIIQSKKIKTMENPFEDPVLSDMEDIDEENEAPIEVLPQTVPSENVLGKCGVWGEAFFFKPNDSRLKEAASFYESHESRENKDFSKRRKQLRSIVKKKIQNSRRDKKVFKRKLGGKINRTKFKMRLRKIDSNH